VEDEGKRSLLPQNLREIHLTDSVLKAAISKYGLNQWARCASLLAKKSAKQCKVRADHMVHMAESRREKLTSLQMRWSEYIDPSLKRTEWTVEEDQRLLTMAKLLPTQWRTIAPIVGRSATQCLERYQKLLDDQEAREGGDLGLAGPEGGEAAAPSADDVRRLRPGEVDAYAESRPARPDAIGKYPSKPLTKLKKETDFLFLDLDEDSKEMYVLPENESQFMRILTLDRLSEARARLANVSGKKVCFFLLSPISPIANYAYTDSRKAKRKARERQLEESRRVALLQKRRELKAAGINIKITAKKGNHIDYNADVPLEKEVPAGFFDTTEELDRNEQQREASTRESNNWPPRGKTKSKMEVGSERRRKKRSRGVSQHLMRRLRKCRRYGKQSRAASDVALCSHLRRLGRLSWKTSSRWERLGNARLLQAVATTLQLRA
jgi:pre-mRNA-splicing factor CDC5/CEF1